MSTTKNTKKVSAFAAFSSKIKSDKSATSKARSSKRTASPTAKLQYDEGNLLDAFQAIKEGMSIHKASRQYGVPKSALRDSSREKVSTDRRRPQQSSKPTASPTARRKRDAVQAAQKGKSGSKASKQDGIPESTLPDKARGNASHRKPRQSSKPTTSPTARHKHDETSLRNAVQATQKRKSVKKVSKKDGVPESTLPNKSEKPQPAVQPTTSSTPRLQYEEVSLVNAFQATKDGMSVCKASKLYGVPESTLRDRTKGNVSIDRTRHKQFIPPTTSRKSRCQYDEVNALNAIKAIQEGMTIYRAARQFGVPESTLRDKTRGIVKIDSTKREQSSEPTELKIPKRRLYDETKLINAFRATQEGSSVYKAARQYGVPESTLRDRLRGIYPIEFLRCGPENKFTRDQEQEMVDYMKYMAHIGYQYARCDIRMLAGDYANACGKGLTAKKPLSSNWYCRFIKRWPDLQLIFKPKKVSEARWGTQDALDNYFKELADIVTTNDLLESPERIYNIDGCHLSAKHTPPKKMSDVEAQAVSIIAGGNASGCYIPPYLVFPGKRWNQLLVEGSPPETAGVMSDNSWSNSEILKNYLQKHFAKHAYLSDSKRKGYKTLVLYDGRKYHLSLFMADWAKKNHVILFVLPPFGSPLTEPQDAGLLGPFKSMYTSECQLHHTIYPGIRITKYDVAKLAAKPYLRAMSPSNLQAVFSKAGIYPFPNVSVAPSAISSSSSDDQDKQDGTVQQKSAADSQTNLNGTVARQVTIITTPAPAFNKSRRSERVKKTPTKKKRSTTSSDAGPTNKKSCQGISAEDGSDDCGGIETQLLESTTISSPLPDPSGCASVSTTSSISSDDEEANSDDEEANCCVCGRFSPPAIKHCSSLILVKWARCDKCGHWTHLSFCTNISVVRRDSPFLCPHCLRK